MSNPAPAYVEPILRELLPGLQGKYKPTDGTRSWQWCLEVWDFAVSIQCVKARETGNVVEVALKASRTGPLPGRDVRTAEEFRVIINEIRAYLLGVAAALTQACGANGRPASDPFLDEFLADALCGEPREPSGFFDPVTGREA